MRRLILCACLAVAAIWALAVFVRVELGYWRRRVAHRIACALMQCDEAAP